MRTTLLKRAFAAAVGSARPLDDALMLIGFPQSGKTLANRLGIDLASSARSTGRIRSRQLRHAAFRSAGFNPSPPESTRSFYQRRTEAITQQVRYDLRFG
jgi:hypothetical protein